MGSRIGLEEKKREEVRWEGDLDNLVMKNGGKEDSGIGGMEYRV